MWGRRRFVFISLFVWVNAFASIDLVGAQAIRQPVQALMAEDRLVEWVGSEVIHNAAGFAWAERVAINLAPSWWQSWWAYLLYALLAIVLLRFYINVRIQRALMQQERITRQQKAEQSHTQPDRQYSPQAPLPTSRSHSAASVPVVSALLVRQPSSERQNGQRSADPRSTSAFQEELQTVLEGNFSNSRFGVEELAQAMGLSRVHLYRKIKAFSGLTASELIRNYRLAQATGLLRMGHTITETAYSVGFDSPAYFAKCFRDMYNVTPSDFQNRENSTQTSSQR